MLPQEAVAAEQKVLGVKVERLLSMLMEAEAQMNEGMAVMDKRERAGKDSSCNQLTQQLSLCKASTSRLHSSTASNAVRQSSAIMFIAFGSLYSLLRISSLL